MRLALLDDYQRVALSMADWTRLAPRVTVDVFHDHVGDFERLVQRLLPYDIIMVIRERTRFPRALFERLPRLKLLVTAATWNAGIDLDAATDHNVQVCGTSETASAAAELTLAMMLSLARRIPAEDRAVREGRWVTTLGNILHGKTLGLIGLGHVGGQVARFGAALGMRVLAWSHNLTREAAAERGAELVDLHDLLARADIVSIHTKLSDRTRGLLGREELSLMRPSALLINTARGPILDETALVELLQQRRIAGAALDVFDQEPLPKDHPLCRLDNVILLPHLGYVVEENYHLFYTLAVEDIEAFLEGRVIRPQNTLAHPNFGKREKVPT